MNLQKPSLQEKVGQLLVFGFDGTIISEEMTHLIREHHVGGVILFGRNIGCPEDVLNLTRNLQNVAKHAGHQYPLLICMDQENGAVRRLGEGTTIFPGSMLLGATDNPQNAYDVGVATGKELKALGINWNLAPVVDVNNNPLNPVIGIRSYGESPERVSEFGKAAMKGMQDAGVITTLKHFPGHGDTDTDSHFDLPVISHNMDRLEEVELKPFIHGIQGGADTIMTAHVYFPAIEKTEGVPATISKKVITGLLRKKLGFKGVITTDCLEMNAIKNTIGTARGAVEALKAGVDLLMVSHSFHLQKETIHAIIEAVESGEIDERLIDQAYERVQKLKQKYLKWEEIPINASNLSVPEVVGCKEHIQLANDVYRQGITILQNKRNILPLSSSSEHRVLVVYPENRFTMQVEDKKYAALSLGDIVQKIHPAADVAVLLNPPCKEEVEQIKVKAENYDTIIIGTLTVLPGDPLITLIEELNKTNQNIIVVAMRSPYDLAFLPDVPVYVCTYEFTYPALNIAVKALYGIEKVSGKLPVTIGKSMIIK